MMTPPQSTNTLTDAELDPLVGGIILNNNRVGPLPYYPVGQDPVEREPWWHGFRSPLLIQSGQYKRPIWKRPR